MQLEERNKYFGPINDSIIGSVPLLTGEIGPFLSEVRNNRLGPIKGS
jgi:hypothetical protein